MEYICTLDVNHSCKLLVKKDIKNFCEGNASCSYYQQEAKVSATPAGYVRKERWYEKYYK